MPDIEGQLRSYGDAVEAELLRDPSPSDLAMAGRRSRRPLVLGAVAAAAVVLLVVGGVIAVRASDDDGSAATAATRPRTRLVPPVTAELRLDTTVVHRGQDVIATVVFDNRTDHAVEAPGACLPRWAVEIGRTRAAAARDRLEYADCNPRGRGMRFPPGATSRRIVLATSPHVCPAATGCVPFRPHRTNVWLLADAPGVGRAPPVALRILGAPRPAFCRAEDLAVDRPRPDTLGQDPSPALLLTVRNTSEHRCTLVGAPVVQSQQGSEPPVAPPRKLILGPGASASALLRVVVLPTPPCRPVGEGSWLTLPNGGGTLDSSLPTGTCIVDQGRALTNFVPGTAVSVPLGAEPPRRTNRSA